MAFTKEAALSLLSRAHENRRLAHAYLISGPAGSGKRWLANGLTILVTGDAHPTRHPDVHIAEPESKSRRIVIEQMRELERELQMRATRSGRKVGIVFDADRLQIQASNAFLKTLEEPPSNSLLVLTSEQPQALPETILSRCISVPLSRAGRAELSSAQKQVVADLSDFFRDSKRDVGAVYGLLRKFTRLLQQAREQIAEENAGELKKEESHYRQTTDGRWLEEREDFYKALNEARYAQERKVLIEMLVQWWADVLRQQENFRELDLPSSASPTSALGAQMRSSDVLWRIGHLETLRENLDRNVREDLALEVAFLHAFGAADYL